jgi:hypothetical protein
MFYGIADPPSFSFFPSFPEFHGVAPTSKTCSESDFGHNRACFCVYIYLVSLIFCVSYCFALMSAHLKTQRQSRLCRMTFSWEKSFSNEPFTGVQCIGNIYESAPLSGYKTFLLPQKEILYSLEFLLVFSLKLLQGHRAIFLPLWIYLFWKFHINGVIQLMSFSVGFFDLA